jgi:hypothetical protein
MRPRRSNHFRQYAHARASHPRFKRRSKSSFGTQILVLSGLVGLAAWNYAPQATSAWAALSTPRETLAEFEHSAFYPNCDAARAAGVAPIQHGQPGYRDELDADSDGVACEPYRGY